jgi:hypothetical protein
MLMSMHRIALCTHALHIMLVSHIYTFALDPAEPESEFQAKQAQGMFGCPLASSCEDTNIIVIKASPDASNHLP